MVSLCCCGRLYTGWLGTPKGAIQAGFDLHFQHCDQPLRDASLYLLPSLRGGGGISRRLWLALHERVRAGADLYVSHHDCLLSPFNEPFGLEVQARERRSGPAEFTLAGLPGVVLHCDAPVRLHLAARGAEVLGCEADGQPVFTRADLGAGKVYFLAVPLEDALSRQPGAFYGPAAQPLWQIYRQIAAPHLAGRILIQNDPRVGATEHVLGDAERLVVLINYSPVPVEFASALQRGWRLESCWYGVAVQGDGTTLRGMLPANDALVCRLVTADPATRARP